MNPQFPLYIVSKGRADTRLTSKALERMGVPYNIIIEEQEYDLYAQHISPEKILVLPPEYKNNYNTFDELGLTKSTGPGPARNFAWEHSISRGYSWHWVLDDNITEFWRLNNNLKVPVDDGTVLKCMEDFTLRYNNVGMSGPNYYMFAPRKAKVKPFVTNTRIYSCNLIKNDLPYRWRGRYNEDTDLSLRMLKDGWATIQFNAFLQKKTTTQKMKGGNTKDFYDKEGTYPKSIMLVKMHPDVARLCYKFGRHHHYVDYKKFANLKLIKKENNIPDKINNYGMVLKHVGYLKERDKTTPSIIG